MKLPVCAVFDIGKTNKKLFLFNEKYEIVFEKTTNTHEITDEDGFPCDNIHELTDWLLDTYAEVCKNSDFEIKAMNFSGYGASFALIGENEQPIAPIYNYLKPYSPKLLNEFYEKFGGKELFPKIAASPILGNLNSGMQLYRIKYEKPALWLQIKHALHLPQYLSSIFSKKHDSEITSIGCHTNLWNFNENSYHNWVNTEQIAKILPAIVDSTSTYTVNNIKIGIGLHDSSSALIPYLISQKVPFILISTGTWCISLNPFNQSVLTDVELQSDCLAFLQYNRKPVKASRLFAGQFHEDETKRIAKYFNVQEGFFKEIKFDKNQIEKINKNISEDSTLTQCIFKERSLEQFSDYTTAYYQLIYDLIVQQVFSTNLLLNNSNLITNILVDGGFSKNEIYMHLLAEKYPDFNIFGAEVSQASALGAAVVIHDHWNTEAIPENLITLRAY